MSGGLNLSRGSNIWVVSLKIVFNVWRFQPALNWNRFLADLRRGSNSLNSDTELRFKIKIFLKGTVSEISSDPPFKDGDARFTTAPLTALCYQMWIRYPCLIVFITCFFILRVLYQSVLFNALLYAESKSAWSNQGSVMCLVPILIQ